jgi:hypothetical protein
MFQHDIAIFMVYVPSLKTVYSKMNYISETANW